ncbi:hypothetical protein B0H14DRAFT_45833 [Mycena olivaceomarginata]|nr:hypothetical protein B0H14DRAFT_45833 [Mycena olivaceomarginata]
MGCCVSWLSTPTTTARTRATQCFLSLRPHDDLTSHHLIHHARDDSRLGAGVKAPMSHDQGSDVHAPIPRHGMAVALADLRYRPRRVSAVHFATRARARLQGSLRDQDDRRLAPLIPPFYSTCYQGRGASSRASFRCAKDEAECGLATAIDTGIILDACAQLWDSGEDVWRPLR